jgi:hypothetical protein
MGSFGLKEAAFRGGLRMNGMTPLALPVDLPVWGLASFKITRPELRAMLGEPHYVETDAQRTCGGEQDAWACTLPGGQRVLVILDVTSGCAELCADPPTLGPVLGALSLSRDDARLDCHAEPFVLK